MSKKKSPAPHSKRGQRVQTRKEKDVKALEKATDAFLKVYAPAMKELAKH